MPRESKKLTPEEVFNLFCGLTVAEQLKVFATIKSHMDEAEIERKQLSSEYQKLNGHQ